MTMTDRSNENATDMNRRVFLAAAAGGMATTALTPMTALASAPGVDPDVDGKLQTEPERRRLAEPGPMIPPVPAILLTVNGAQGDPDEISVVWTFIIEGQPPHVGIAVGDHHIAGKLIELHREFVLNVPVSSIIKRFDTVDMNSSEIGDKFELSGLTRGAAVAVNAPTVEECPIQVECRVFDSLRVPPARTVFIAEVIATTATTDAVDEDGRLVVPAVPFFGMTAGSGEFYTMGQLVGNIGQTVGRNDIKY
jgi:flavin reductase (DIM6/NTAB) family NADH-FMN oxidoreductase RutF